MSILLREQIAPARVMLLCMHMRKACAVSPVLLALLLALLLTGCGSGPAIRAEEPRDEVPPATAARFAAEAAGHGSVEEESGCVTETAGERLAAEQARQEDEGTPVDGWLLEVPRETRIYVCRYVGTFEGRPNTALAVWEAADESMGGPRPALEFHTR